MILLVEDDFYSCEFIKELLNYRPLELVCAPTGKSALEIVRSGADVQLILMDIRLPDVNGLTLTRTIKSEKPHIPIIAQTAYASPNDIEECYNAGCDGYLSKPIDPVKMKALVDKYL